MTALLYKIKRFFIFCFYSIVFGSIAFTASWVYAGWNPPIVEKIVEVQPERLDLAAMVEKTAGEYGLDPLLLRAIIRAESGGRANAIKLEPTHLARKDVKEYGRTQDERTMYASSFGLMQVMGWHAPAYGLQWSDLLEPSVNLKVGAEILKDCLERQSTKSKVEKLRGGLRCYNGGDKYPDLILENMGAILAEGMKL
jgi:soluble lytic murein transglycosylase-like protein